MSGTHTYLSEYLPQVLGVSSFLNPYQVQAETDENQIIRCRVLFRTDKPLSAAGLDLFQKMATAMKLAESDFCLEQGSESSGRLIQADWTVHFVSSTAPQDAPRPSWTQTLSPEVLVHQPELKRKVWQDLQLVMKNLKIG